MGLNHVSQTIVACCVLHDLCQISGEPEPELCKDPEENGGGLQGCLDREKSFYYLWESLWQAMADDLHQEMVSQSFKV